MPFSIPLKLLRLPRGGPYRAVEDDAASNAFPNDQDSDTALPGWPHSPRPLKKSWLALLGEITLVIFPVAFIVLAATAWGVNGQPVNSQPNSNYGHSVQRAMLLGPTLFPLAFAALGGRGFKTIALWRAERGSTIGELERLDGSQSFVSAIWLTISLRSFNILSAAVVLFWSLSPLGGQSSLRLLRVENATIIESRPIYFSNPDTSSWLSFPDAVSYLNQASAMLSTSIQTGNALNNSAVDSWNHPKIPRIKELEQQTPNNETDRDWIDSPEDIDTSYASLLGISVIGLQRDTTATFSAHYEYMYLNCGLRLKADSNSTMDFFLSLPERYIEPTGWPYNYSEGASDLHRVFNVTYVMPMQIAYYESSFFFVSTHNDTNGTLPAARYFYGSRHLNQQIATYECAMHSLMVEASVKCSGAACAVEKLRRSMEPRAISDNSTGRPWDVVHTYQAYRYFIEYFSSLGGTVSRYSRHPIDNYVYGRSSAAYLDQFFEYDWTLVSDIEMSSVSLRSSTPTGTRVAGYIPQG